MASCSYYSCKYFDCERGFSKRNIIKDVRKSNLGLDTLDALMRVSLNRWEINDVN